MAFPTPVITTLIIFLVFAFLASLVALWMKRTKKLSHDNAQVCCLSIIVATFCLYIMWLCTWLHQWHPLIVPTKNPAAAAAAAGGHSSGGH